jgi:hypothetical protein
MQNAVSKGKRQPQERKMKGIKLTGTYIFLVFAGALNIHSLVVSSSLCLYTFIRFTPYASPVINNAVRPPSNGTSTGSPSSGGKAGGLLPPLLRAVTTTALTALPTFAATSAIPVVPGFTPDASAAVLLGRSAVACCLFRN